MKFYSKAICKSLLATLILSVNSLPVDDTNKNVIKILTEKPDIITQGNWETYNSLIKTFFTSTNADNNVISNLDIQFSYNNDEPVDKKTPEDFEKYAKFVVKELQEANYDMMILDGNFLFSDVAHIESLYIDKRYKREIHLNYKDLTPAVYRETLNYNDPKIVEDGYLNDVLYALPFEKDFDVLYYHTNNPEIANIDMNNLTWDDLLTINTGANSPKSLSIAYGNDDELLNLFTEYTNSKFDLSGKNNANFKAFYNETSKDVYNSFKNFVSKSTALPDLNQLSDITLEKAYDAFIKNECAFFKGKASHYRFLVKENKNNDVAVKLLPKNTSDLTKKYLVVNKHSTKDEKVLIELAVKLTSKEMQFYRAEQFGKIPTFDLNKKDSDPTIKSFVDNNNEMVGLMQSLKVLHMKDIFSSKNSAPFMEIRSLLPGVIRKYLKDGNTNEITNTLENTKELLMDKKNVIHVPTYLLYIPMALFVLTALVILGLVFKYRNHPYLKIYSPGFCSISIIGIIFSILSFAFRMENTSVDKCRYYYIYASIYTDLTLFPMVAITYRIYTIYKNKARDNKIKNLNVRVYIIFVLALLAMIVYAYCVSMFIIKYFLQSYGTITTYRLPNCEYRGNGIYESIERRVNELIYIIMIILVICTGKVSKKYGEFKYIYIMFCVGIMEYGFNFILAKLPSNGYFGYYILTVVINMFLNLLLIYYLIGSKLIYCIKHPNDTEPYNLQDLLK